MSIKITHNRKGLDKLLKNMVELQGHHEIPLTEKMPPKFVAEHSKFATLKELFDASGLDWDSPEAFSAIPNQRWDDFIAENTDFSSWDEMQDSAHADWIKTRINKGL